MPSTNEVVPVSATVSARGGAGGEPLGDLPAPEIRRQLPYEVVDELLAGARTEEEIFGPGGAFG